MPPVSTTNDLLDVQQGLVLFMKAAIQVNRRLTDTTLVDPRQREEDYLQAMRHYLLEQPLIRKIVFVENSAWPLETLQRDAQQHNPHGKQIEFVSLDCNDFPGEFGKGYGEALLIEQGMQRSELVRSSTHVATITGRIRIPNLVGIVTRVRQPFELLCDLRDHRLYDMFRIRACGHHNDNRLVVFTPAFYERVLRPVHHNINGSFDVESAWYHAIKKVEHEPGVIVRFPVEPQYLGRAGHWNKDYAGFTERVKHSVRGTARVLTPWLRI